MKIDALCYFNGALHIIFGNQYIKSTDCWNVDFGYPKPLSELFNFDSCHYADEFKTRIDAMVVLELWGKKRLYVVSGNKYMRCTEKNARFWDIDYATSLDNFLKFKDRNDLAQFKQGFDAMVVHKWHGQEKLYIVKGNQYIRTSADSDFNEVDKGYPYNLSGFLNYGQRTDVDAFKSGIDAMVVHGWHGQNRLYVIKGGQYIRSSENDSGFWNIDSGYPLSVHKNFLNSFEDNKLWGANAEISAIENIFACKKDGNRFGLLIGPPGVGKTWVIQKLAKKHGFEFKEYDQGAPDDQYVGQQTSRTREFFQNAISSGKKVCLFLDEIDTITPANQNDISSYQNKVTREIQKQISKLEGGSVVVFGATNYEHQVAPAVRNRAKPVLFKLPDKPTRAALIKSFLKLYTLENTDIIKNVIRATQGWSPRLIKSYLKAVVVKAEQRSSSKLLQSDFISCYNQYRNNQKASLKHVNVTFPPLMNTSSGVFSQLVGYENNIKEEIQSLTLLLSHPSYYKKSGIVKKNTLFYGPAGTGKTSLAQAIAASTGAVFIYIEPAISGNLGQVLKDSFAFARMCEKSVIFIDEIDSIGRYGALCVNLLKTELEGVNQGNNTQVIIGATNHIDVLERAIQSRFKCLLIPLPNTTQRKKIFQHYLSQSKIKLSPQITDNLETFCQQYAARTEGLSGRKIKEIVDGAWGRALDLSITNNTKNPVLTAELLHQKILSAMNSGLHNRDAPIPGYHNAR